MTFRRRLQLSLSVLIMVMAISAAAGLVTLRVVLGAHQQALALSDELVLVQDMRLAAEQLVSAGRRYLLAGNESAKRKLDATDAAFDRAMQVVQHAHGTRGEQRALRALFDAANAYVAAIRTSAAARVAAGDPATILDVFEEHILDMRARFDRAANEYVEEVRSSRSGSTQAAASTAGSAQLALPVLLALSLSLAFGIAWMVARRLVRQYRCIEETTDVARRASADRDELLAIVSHDLRTPLTAVTMGAEALEQTPLPPEARRAVSVIASAGERMTHLIDDLLVREQLSSGTFVLERAPHDAAAMISTAVELQQHRARRAGIDLRGEGPTLMVDADRERVLQVLSNLIGNAIKFAGAGERVVAEAHPDPDGVRFEVTDTGQGIPPDHVPRLFDRSFQGTSSRERGSLGLGLYICKRIVEAHGGHIGARSKLGTGTTLWFTIASVGNPSAIVTVA
jgi:signal transduction histidine kinase